MAEKALHFASHRYTASELAAPAHGSVPESGEFRYGLGVKLAYF